jgi:hypothetical protein
MIPRYQDRIAEFGKAKTHGKTGGKPGTDGTFSVFSCKNRRTFRLSPGFAVVTVDLAGVIFIA